MKQPSNENNCSGIEKRASRTALWTAIYRDLASRETHPVFRGPDNMATYFLPPVAKFFLFFSFTRRYLRKKATPGSYEYIVARTKFFNDLFKRALEENIPQIVLLGAGYDTRAIRFKDLIRQTQIFELDAPTTQERKREYFHKAGISIPQQLAFLPINFGKEGMEAVFAASGYDKSQKSIFIWEGVTMYLTEEAVTNTLAFIRRNAGSGSTLSFDYFYKSVVEGKSAYYGAREQHQAVIKVGEPFKFGIDEGKIESFLLESGFKILSHYNPDEFEKKYLYDDGGNRLGKKYRCACNVHAAIVS